MSDYCIYLDGPSADLSKEHIIPMSLGGLDGFGHCASFGSH